MLKLRTLIQVSILTLFLCVDSGLSAHAGMVGTHQLLDGPSMLQDVALQRQNIRQQLIEYGVEPQQAGIRVASMSDSQVSQISSRIQDLPAGASVGGIILTVFIVFVITDVIGATDIFPFIHPVK